MATVVSGLSDEDKLYEVVEGRIVAKPSGDAYGTALASSLAVDMSRLARENRRGLVVIESLFDLRPGVDRARRPNVAFISAEAWPLDRRPPRPRRGRWCRNWSSRWSARPVRPRASWARSGDTSRPVPEWSGSSNLEHPEVYVYTSPKEVRVLDGDDVLDGGAVLPGFRLRCATSSASRPRLLEGRARPWTGRRRATLIVSSVRSRAERCRGGREMRRAACGLALAALMLGAGPDSGRERFAPDEAALRGLRTGGRNPGGDAGQGLPGADRPHWFAGNTRLWVSQRQPGRHPRVPPRRRKRPREGRPLTMRRLAERQLSKAAGSDYKGERLPLDEIDPADDGKSVKFKVGSTTWTCDLGSYACTKAENPEPEAISPAIPTEYEPDERESPQQRRGRPAEPRALRSPDGRWFAEVKDYNVVLRPAGGGKEIVLSDNGQPDFAFAELSWSPCGRVLLRAP